MLVLLLEHLISKFQLRASWVFYFDVEVLFPIFIMTVAFGFLFMDITIKLEILFCEPRLNNDLCVVSHQFHVNKAITISVEELGWLFV